MDAKNEIINFEGMCLFELTGVNLSAEQVVVGYLKGSGVKNLLKRER